MRKFLAAGALLLLAACIHGKHAGGGNCAVAGRYAVAGLTPDGGAYTGVADVTAERGACYVRWAEPNTSEGLGPFKNGKLKVKFEMSGAHGVVVYRQRQDGALEGLWWMDSAPDRHGSETLTPAPG